MIGACADIGLRVLINSERVGGLGSRPDDVLILGDCDTGVRKLAEALGWLEELEAAWAKTQPEPPTPKVTEPLKDKDERLVDEVEKLTADIDASLKISQEHEDFVRKQLAKGHEKSTPEESDEAKISLGDTPEVADRPEDIPKEPNDAQQKESETDKVAPESGDSVAATLQKN